MRGHVGQRVATGGQEVPREVTWGCELPYQPPVSTKDFAQCPYQPTVITGNFAQCPYQPLVITKDFSQFPYQPLVITEDFSQFPYQPRVKQYGKQNKLLQMARRVQKLPRRMNLCKTVQKMQVVRTSCTRVRARSVPLKRFSEKRV